MRAFSQRSDGRPTTGRVRPRLRVGLALLCMLACSPRQDAEIYKRTPQGSLAIHLHFPRGEHRGPRPAIVFFFGGGWTGGSVAQFEHVADRLAEHGMLAVRADYRVHSRHGTPPTAAVEDAKSALRWLRARAVELGIDPERIAAAGGSAGGHLAASTALVEGFEDREGRDSDVSSRSNLLILYNPVLDVEKIHRRAASYDLMETLEGVDAGLARRLSPLHQLSRGAPATLLVYGTSDDLLVHGRDFLGRARELGVETELWTAQGQPHGFFNESPWRESVLAIVLRFLWRHGYLDREPHVDPSPAAPLGRSGSSP